MAPWHHIEETLNENNKLLKCIIKQKLVLNENAKGNLGKILQITFM